MLYICVVVLYCVGYLYCIFVFDPNSHKQPAHGCGLLLIWTLVSFFISTDLIKTLTLAESVQKSTAEEKKF